ncbi:hypothetical protein HYH03_004555 [Edaphochlamys debaryana]|uniref:Uncharacterized protein n=1 Tax=Edaphochlamys debaryana TaxID=47281 RepID=A0A835Y703_9CHLO|nr:hypothetical protein HYH03_004555 [Edaphochlamys debaryana]|eukprot:KAG2497400.1 hypothetical protein HYH03_004555 [Edaphochlamys debaryana]
MVAKAPFDSLEDTPMFRAKAGEMEAGCRRLRDRVTALVGHYRRYRDSLVSLCKAQSAFVGGLAEFFGGPDGEDLAAGVPVNKYISTLGETTTYFDLLKIQIEFAADQISAEWLDDLLVGARESHRAFERAAGDAEDAAGRCLALKKGTKREVLDRAAAEMAAARAVAEEARFDVARRLTAVEARRRYSFLQLLLDSVGAHHAALRSGSEMLGRLTPLGDAARGVVAEAKAAEGEVQVKLAEEAARCKVASTAAAAAAAGAASYSDESMHGPVQMTAAKSAAAVAAEAALRATRAAQVAGDADAPVAVLRQGYLLKRSGGAGAVGAGGAKAVAGEWRRRFFVLDSRGQLYYYSHKDSLLNRLRGVDAPAAPAATCVQLLTSTVKMDDEADPGLRFCFRVVSPTGTLALQAESEADRAAWVSLLQVVIGTLLNAVSSDGGAALPPPASPGQGRGPGLASAGGSGALGPGGPGLGLGLASVSSGFGPGHSPRLSEDLRGLSLGGVGGPGTPSRPSGAGEHAAATPLELIRRIPGNGACCDCGAPEPDWASLNLGCCLCIECSGVHRQLGVQVSKVRSLTLDVRVWEPSIIELFSQLGNTAVNHVWEAKLEAKQAGAAAAAASLSSPVLSAASAAHSGSGGGAAGGGRPGVDDTWVWCEDEEDDGLTEKMTRRALAAAAGRAGIGGGGGGGGASGESWLLSKPHLRAPLAEKQRYINVKYAGRMYVAPPPPHVATGPGGREQQLGLLLWHAVEAADARGALQALAWGAVPALPVRCPRAALLIQEMRELAGAAESPLGGSLGGGLGHGSAPGSGGAPRALALPPLHLAAYEGSGALLELLLQNGAPVDGVDAAGGGHTALHYALLADRYDAAKLLLRRGASLAAADAEGRRAWDLVVGVKGRVGDEELFLLLNGGAPGPGPAAALG